MSPAATVRYTRAATGNETAHTNDDIDDLVRRHILPGLEVWRHPVALDDAQSAISETVALLLSAREQVVEHGIADVKSFLRSQLLRGLSRTQHKRLQRTLAYAMYEHVQSLLDNSEGCVGEDECGCSMNVGSLALDQLARVGLGDAIGHRAFAHAIHRLICDVAVKRRCFQVDWVGKTSVVPKLRRWIDSQLTPFVEVALRALSDGHHAMSPNDAAQLGTMAATNLGHARSEALFDYVKTWPASAGAIQDIREYVVAGGIAHKAAVCKAFVEQVQRRLLHAGAGTAEILSIYVNTIHAFKLLDARGVMLGKVAMPIRSYLRTRDDTVSIIAASFLADVDEDGKVAGDGDRICADIARAVTNGTMHEGHQGRCLDWDDMEWMPDPIDATPDYRQTKAEDIVAYVLNLFDQEEFIKEITSVLAQHLLYSKDTTYLKETRLVELFKARLDSSKLQAAEVMLKDVRDSVTLNRRLASRLQNEKPPTAWEVQAAIPPEGIALSSLYDQFKDRADRTQFIATVKVVADRRGDLLVAKRRREDAAAVVAQVSAPPGELYVQVLSGFYWPQVRTDDFAMPSVLQPALDRFNSAFAGLGNQRKIKFRPALSRMSLKLELEDRVVEEKDVPTWRASVADLFAREAGAFTAEEIVTALQMDEDLVTDALAFWSQRRVLYQPQPQVYSVLERLDMDVAPAKQQHYDDALPAAASALQTHAPVFQLFIANMLRNSGPKEVGGMMGITGLLRMVNPDFVYGDEETMELLQAMEAKGEVERRGEMWAVK